MNGLPYYKAYPRDFIEGTIGMSFELKGAYRLVLDLIYMQGGELPDDARYISGLLGCSIRKWNSMREQLVALGKIQVSGASLTNYRAVSELQNLAKIQDKQRENASGPRKNNDLAKPPLNHTEPEPEPEKEENKNSSSSTLRPREEDGAAAAAFSKLDLEEEPVAFDELAARLAQLWHDQGLEVPAMAHARTWLGEGHSPDTIVATVKAKLATLAGRRAATLVWFDKAIAEAKPQPSAPKKPAPPTIYVRQLDSAWPAYAEAYRTMKGKDPPTDRAGGWHFPIDLLPAHSTH